MTTLGKLRFVAQSDDVYSEPIDSYITIRVGADQCRSIHVRGEATAEQLTDLLMGLLDGAANRARQPAEVMRVEVEDGLAEHVVVCRNSSPCPVLRLGPGGDFVRDFS